MSNSYLQAPQPYWLAGSVILAEGLLPSIAMARRMPCLPGTSNPSLVHALRGQGYGSLAPPNQATFCIVWLQPRMQGGGPLDASLSGKSWRKAEKGKGHRTVGAEEASNEEPTPGLFICFLSYTLMFLSLHSRPDASGLECDPCV